MTRSLKVSAKLNLRVRWWDHDEDDDTDQLFEELIVSAPKKTMACLKAIKHDSAELRGIYHDLCKNENKQRKRKKNK